VKKSKSATEMRAKLAKRMKEMGGEPTAELTGQEAINAVMGLHVVSQPAKIAPPTEPKPQIILYLRDGVNPADRNFTKYPNEMHDLMAEELTEYENIAYVKLWRESWGYGRNYCRIAYSTILENTSLRSLSTVRRSVGGLREKKFIILVLDKDRGSDTTKAGTLYRVFTPAEILKGLADEGVPLADLPSEGVFCENIVTENTVINADNTVGNDTVFTGNMLTGNSVQAEHGQSEHSTMSTQNMVTENTVTQGKVDSASGEGVLTEHGQREQHLKEDSLKDSLSLNPVDLFYTGIGQTKISKAKRERGNKVVQELKADGFSLEDIAYAAEWTPKNAKEEVYDMEILKHTIGKAIPAREAGQQATEREREEAARVSVAEEERRRLEGEIQEIRSRKSKSELTELRKKAEKEIRESGEYQEQFITDMLITGKENEILRSKMGENEC